jgi:hypothetical protein
MDYYDRAGNPVAMMEWAQGFERDDRKVGRDEVGEASVSTVHLGLNHQFGDGPPLIFETMIFGGEHDQACWRYSTEEQAKAGHERVVEALRKGEDPDV